MIEGAAPQTLLFWDVGSVGDTPKQEVLRKHENMNWSLNEQTQHTCGRAIAQLAPAETGALAQTRRETT